MMIGDTAQQRFRPVELFEEYHSGQLVREGLRAEGQQTARPFPYGGVQAEGSADDKTGTARSIGGHSVQKAGKFSRGQGTALLIEADHHILRLQRGKNAPAFVFDASGDGQRRVGIADDGVRHLTPANQPFQIVGGGLLPEGGARTAYRDNP